MISDRLQGLFTWHLSKRLKTKKRRLIGAYKRESCNSSWRHWQEIESQLFKVTLFLNLSSVKPWLVQLHCKYSIQTTEAPEVFLVNSVIVITKNATFLRSILHISWREVRRDAKLESLKYGAAFSHKAPIKMKESLENQSSSTFIIYDVKLKTV